MRYSRFVQVVSGLSSIALKVYHAVPITEAWTAAQINSELRRQGVTKSTDIVEGCLANLVDNDLVLEKPMGTFRRIEVREPEKKQMATTPALTVIATSAAPVDPLQVLAALSNRVRQLADEIDTIALQVDGMFAAVAKDSEKLRQLQNLLKG